jgi:hypothetical protein
VAIYISDVKFLLSSINKNDTTKKRTEETYNNRNNNVRQESQSNVWMLRLRSRTKLIILGNSTEKYKEKLNSK